MMQAFCLHLPANASKEKIEQAKLDKGSASSEMGFNFVGEWEIKQVEESGKRATRVEAVFSNSREWYKA